jgi:Carboxypeptidase regulatory-like domain
MEPKPGLRNLIISMKPLLLILVTFVATLVSMPALAQDKSAHGSATTRSVEGIVTNGDGTPSGGGQVLLKDMKSLAVRSFITQPDGRYHFYGLSSDSDYEIHAQSGGSASPTKNLSVFDGHKVITLNLKLK